MISSSRFLSLLLAAITIYVAPCFSLDARETNTPLPRSLVTLYNSETQKEVRFTSPHLYLEMPANHLGYRMLYFDINEPLPPLPESVKAVVLWLDDGDKVPNTKQYINWLNQAIDSGKKIILIGEIGVPDSYTSTAEGFAHLNSFLSRLGLVDQSRWISLTYNASISYQNLAMTGFERDYGAPLPPYRYMQAIPEIGTSHLQITNPLHSEGPADLVVTSPAGGYVSSNYAMYHLTRRETDDEDEEWVKFRQWYLNPFAFLRMILDEEELPKPDITTLAGRRIFYSHIDGDGWNNLTTVEKYNKQQVTSAEVIHNEIYSRFKDIPFSVGIIVAEILTECFGFPTSKSIAEKTLKLPNIEPSSHTYSHPFYWRFFENREPEKEIPLLKYYPPRPTYNIRFLGTLLEDHKNPWKKYGVNFDELATHTPYAEREIATWLKQEGIAPKTMEKYHGRPRSYACAPFDLKKEIVDAVEVINSLAPENKKVKLVQWSGDTAPYEEALRMARENNLLNINGGDSRFDDEYPSYASVAPVGLRVGKEWQVYSSNSNENTYTKLWTDRFFGFRYLKTTINNTETPWRIVPFNVYFHTYSGEREASLNALIENLNFARTKEIIPIFTSQYAAIAKNFFTTEIVPLAKNSWQIRNRGELQTIRFDKATLKSVDFAKSNGVIGQRYYQGSLYVALNPQVKTPIITIKTHVSPANYPESSTPYIINSRWQIIDLQNSKDELIIAAQGFGKGEMLWKMPRPGYYSITIRNKETVLHQENVQTTGNSLLGLLIDTEAVFPVEIIIKAR